MGPKYQFRSADGSGNSPLDPEMGKSFTPYSRSCSTTRSLPTNELPDPGLLFDSIIKRDKVSALQRSSFPPSYSRLANVSLPISLCPILPDSVDCSLTMPYVFNSDSHGYSTLTAAELLQTTVIHSVFRTSRNDWNINETSSYADLGLLYGNNQAQQDKVRNKDGRGRLLPDVFTETRLLSLPPGVGAVSAIRICFKCF